MMILVRATGRALCFPHGLSLLVAKPIRSYSRKVKKVCIIGAGTVGAELAQMCAAEDYLVALIDKKNHQLSAANYKMEKILKEIGNSRFPEDNEKAKKFPYEALNRIYSTTDIRDGTNGAHLIVEAVTENIQNKRTVFHLVERYAPQTSIIVSTTSSFRIEDIALACTKKKQMYIAGAHFFHPLSIIKAVEVIRTEHSSAETLEIVNHWCESLGKIVIPCTDAPGFIVYRLIIPTILVQSVFMLERGVASVEGIDTAIKLSCNMRCGPFEIIDQIGIDVLVFTLTQWSKASRKGKDAPNQFEVPKTLLTMLEEKKLGVKTGEGFYKYTAKGSLKKSNEDFCKIFRPLNEVDLK